MNAKLFDALAELESAKGIPMAYMLEKIEGALQKPLNARSVPRRARASCWTPLSGI